VHFIVLFISVKQAGRYIFDWALLDDSGDALVYPAVSQQFILPKEKVG
jgi:hypothetical protein